MSIRGSRHRGYHGDVAQIGACGRRVYTSVRHARFVHRLAGFRIGIYHCATCRGYHVRNDEKR